MRDSCLERECEQSKALGVNQTHQNLIAALNTYEEENDMNNDICAHVIHDSDIAAQ